MSACGALHPVLPGVTCTRAHGHTDLRYWRGKRTTMHMAYVHGERQAWARQALRGDGTLAKRSTMETDLREYARQLLALPAGNVTRGRTAFADLEAALDYLSAVVQDGARQGAER